PRVLKMMGQDYRAFRFLAITNERGAPVVAVIAQSIISLIYILTNSFEAILLYASFAMGLTTSLTVAGVIVMRIREPELARPYKAWGYPLSPIVFLLVNAWTLWFLMLDKPEESAWGMLTILSGVGFYFLGKRSNQASATNS
ncbi:MAG: amino acid permease, partial [Bacteroidota bacterium]